MNAEVLKRKYHVKNSRMVVNFEIGEHIPTVSPVDNDIIFINESEFSIGDAMHFKVSDYDADLLYVYFSESFATRVMDEILKYHDM